MAPQQVHQGRAHERPRSVSKELLGIRDRYPDEIPSASACFVQDVLIG